MGEDLLCLRRGGMGGGGGGTNCCEEGSEEEEEEEEEREVGGEVEADKLADAETDKAVDDGRGEEEEEEEEEEEAAARGAEASRDAGIALEVEGFDTFEESFKLCCCCCAAVSAARRVRTLFLP